ncbi:hypothetical protein [Ulvibacterium sp.]|uniref:hypothetical protein n=1 Tax=Ulvibacterium sp. TaxID=2665914 RepID=UPI003BAA0A41
MDSITLGCPDSIYLHFLETIISEEFGNHYRVIGSSANGLESLRTILDRIPKIAFLGTDLPYLTGVDIAKILFLKGIPTKCILVFPKEIEECFIELLIEGVHGIIYKGDDAVTVVRCIKELSTGNFFNSSFFSRK